MLPTTAPATPLALTTDDLAALDKARGWARFVGIIGFIGCGLMAVMALAAVASLAALPEGPGARPLTGAGFVAVVMLVLIGYVATHSWLVMRYASGVRAHTHGDGAALARAFWSLKVLWILTVVTYGLTILFTAIRMLGLVDPPGR